MRPKNKIEAMITKAQEAQFARTRNAEIEATVAAVAAVRPAEFEYARNAEIETALAAYREAQLARQRNAEIDASISAVSVERGRNRRMLKRRLSAPCSRWPKEGPMSKANQTAPRDQ